MGWIRRVEATSDARLLKMTRGGDEEERRDKRGIVSSWATKKHLLIAWEASDEIKGGLPKKDCSEGISEWRQLHVLPSQLAHIRRTPLFSLFLFHLIIRVVRWGWSVVLTACTVKKHRD